MFKIVLALICALLIALFAIQNAIGVTVSFLFWRFKASLVLLILGAGILGAIAVFLLGTLGLIKQRRNLRDTNQTVRELNMEIERLRQQVQVQEKDDNESSIQV